MVKNYISINEAVRWLEYHGVESEKMEPFLQTFMIIKSKYGRDINLFSFDAIIMGYYLECDENVMEDFIDHIVGFYVNSASVEYCTDVYLLLSSCANYFEYIHNTTKAKKAKEMAIKFLNDVCYYRACDEDFIKEFNKLVV